MNERERMLLLMVCTVGGFALLFGGFIGVTSLLENLDQMDQEIVSLQSGNSTAETEVMMLFAAQRKMNEWQQTGFPSDPALVNRRYEAYLRDLAREHQLEIKQITKGTARAASANGQVATFKHTLGVDGTMDRLSAFLKDFYSLNIPHKISEMKIESTEGRNGKDTKLTMLLKIETLSLPNVKPRDYLPSIPDKKLLALDLVSGLAGRPIGLGLALWGVGPVGMYGGEPKLASAHSPDRDYSRLADRNIFVGLTAPPKVVQEKPRKNDENVLEFVRLTDIMRSPTGREAGLYNLRTGESIRLQARAGRNTFEVQDPNDQVVLRGRVTHIERRDIVFTADDKHYRLHVGKSLDDAMKQALSAEQLQAFARLGE